MPTVSTDDGVDLHYELEGEGETVAFVGEAGYGAWQWGWQHGPLAGPYRTLVWDLRGTGRSDAPDGAYGVDRLVADLETVLAEDGTANAHLVGAGLGGMVTLRYAGQYDRAESLSLFGTAPDGDAVDERALRELQPASDDSGALRDSLAGAFSSTFVEANPEMIDRICEWRRAEDADRDAFDRQVAAMCGFEAGPLYELTCPALVFHGVDDPVVPLQAGQTLAEQLPRGRFEAVEGRHLCHVEHAGAVTDRLADFLAQQADDRPF